VAHRIGVGEADDDLDAMAKRAGQIAGIALSRGGVFGFVLFWEFFFVVVLM
jgi:hypothetical protein